MFLVDFWFLSSFWIAWMQTFTPYSEDFQISILYLSDKYFFFKVVRFISWRLHHTGCFLKQKKKKHIPWIVTQNIFFSAILMYVLMNYKKYQKDNELKRIPFYSYICLLFHYLFVNWIIIKLCYINQMPHLLVIIHSVIR